MVAEGGWVVFWGESKKKIIIIITVIETVPPIIDIIIDLRLRNRVVSDTCHCGRSRRQKQTT